MFVTFLFFKTFIENFTNHFQGHLRLQKRTVVALYFVGLGIGYSVLSLMTHARSEIE